MNRSLKKLVTLTCSTALLGSQTLLLQQPAKSQSYLGAAGCPAGTREGAVNLVINGNFATSPGVVNAPLLPGNPAAFTSTLPYRGDGIYPDDNPPAPTPLGGLSIQAGSINYLGGVVVGQPFPGDPQFGIPASNTYLYSNPNASATTPLVQGSAFPDPIVWNQIVTGLSPNTSYNFTAYFYNLLATPATPGAPPVIRLLAGAPGSPAGAFIPTLNGEPVTPVQQWQRVQGVFNTGNLTALELRIVDQANTIIGDDFGMTAVGLRECIPILGVAKNAGTPIDNGNGTFTVPYTVTVRNFAPTGNGIVYDLLNLQLADDLTQTFASASSFSVQPGTIQSPTLTVNTNFSGRPNPGSINLLAGTDTLAAGTTATVTFNVIITPGTGPNGFGVFPNQVAASATSRGGSNVTATSNNGVNPDLDGNGLPDPPSPTQVSLPRPNIPGVGNQRFRLVKRITSATRNGAPIPGVDFGSVVNDPGSTDDDAPGWAQFPPVGVITIPPSNPLQSGDEVTYTVYFLSDGDTPARTVNVCDPIPTSTTFVSGSTELQRPSTSLSPGGAFFPPLAPLPPDNSCTSQTNTNGSVIYDVGDVSNATGSNFGLVRFKVRIN